MMKSRVQTTEVFLTVEQSRQEPDLAGLAAVALGVNRADIGSVRVERRSLDARKRRQTGYRLLLEVGLGAPAPVAPARRVPDRGLGDERVVVVGSGPAGTFAALRLAEAGAQVTLVELGKPVQPRRHDLAKLVKRGELEPSSNYCFGEGGAGTFSDGKLYTRTRDRDAVREVLAILVAHGADPDIRIDNRPHIGSNILPKVLMGMREELEALGVTYRWSDPLVDLAVVDGRVRAARLASGLELPCDRLILATGHSARALYERLDELGVACEARPFAIGARVEHAQPFIDRAQYGGGPGMEQLPAAFYHVTAQVPGGDRERGVYSFCMCPGGWIVNSSTEPEMLATNGMSLKRRDSPFANAALVVQVMPEDYASFARRPGDPLAGMYFQRAVEEKAYRLGGGGFVAPAQRLTDLRARRASSTVGPTSYRPGIIATDLAEALPPFVMEALRGAVGVFDRTMRGFLSEEAHLVGVETRTSAPVRLSRVDETCESPSHQRLYPCGEGGGYAGGIISAAIDGLKVADAICASRGVAVRWV